MKKPSTLLLNTTTPAGRLQGEATNDPGGDTGSGVDQEIYNDPVYAAIAPIESWKEGGISDSDETTDNSDMRDSIEEMVSKKVFGVSGWAIGTNYSAPGELSNLVMWKGFQFINISNVGNLGNDPLLFPKLWFKIPKVDTLMDQFYNGAPVSGALSPIADRAGGQYLQNMLFGNYRIGGNGDDFSDFFRVALDGTIVTGNATLEAIFDVGGGSEYFNLDLIAPDVLGTRTLLDMGEYGTAFQSLSGQSDIMGEQQEDRIQGHWHELFGFSPTGDVNQFDGGESLAGGATGGWLKDSGAVNAQFSVNSVKEPITGVSGVVNTGATTRGKQLVQGICYIIVMVAA